MLDRDTTPRDMLLSTIDEHLENSVYTSLPAIITKITDYGEQQTVDAKIAVNRVFPDYNRLNGATCADIPIMFPSAGGGILSFPVKVGDGVLICFSKRSIDEFLLGSGEDQVDPKLKRQFSLSDGIAIPGLYTIRNNLKPDPDHTVLKFADNAITLFNDGNLKIESPGNIDVVAGGNVNVEADGSASVMAGSSISLEASSIDITGTVTVNGAVTMSSSLAVAGSMTNAGTNVGSSHRHGGVSTGGGTTQGPQ